MDSRLQDLCNNTTAEVTVKLSRSFCLVIIRHEGQTYKASGVSVQKATDKVLEAFGKHRDNIKELRREKEAAKRAWENWHLEKYNQSK